MWGIAGAIYAVLAILIWGFILYVLRVDDVLNANKKRVQFTIALPILPIWALANIVADIIMWAKGRKNG